MMHAGNETCGKTVSPILEKGAGPFNIIVEELKEKFKDAHWRRELASVIKSLAVFGVRRPSVPGAPFQVQALLCNCWKDFGERINNR